MLFAQDIASAIPVLRKGGLILFPTDTVWAIGCDATNAAAVERLYRLKQHRTPENLVVLVAGEEDVYKYTRQQKLRFFDYIKGVHKPTTIVYEEPTGLAENIIDDDGTIAIRVVKDAFVTRLIQYFEKPVLTATANQHNHPYPHNFSQIEPAVKKGVQYIVQYRQDETIAGEPSSIIRWHADGSITILRP
jgi:L-threonylcarbamoyladenylate synthase